MGRWGKNLEGAPGGDGVGRHLCPAGLERQPGAQGPPQRERGVGGGALRVESLGVRAAASAVTVPPTFRLASCTPISYYRSGGGPSGD